MDGLIDYHAKQSKSERERQIYIYNLLWNLKYDTNELIYKKETNSQTQRTNLWLLRWMGCRGGLDWEFGTSRCKLLYIAWINSKVLSYSIGNYIQYSVINHNGKEKKKTLWDA